MKKSSSFELKSAKTQIISDFKRLSWKTLYNGDFILYAQQLKSSSILKNPDVPIFFV